jgi:hypothetical protein
MARPRDPNVEEVPGTCEVHGRVLMRRHKVGFHRSGAQKYRLRCPACHSAANRPAAKP